MHVHVRTMYIHIHVHYIVLALFHMRQFVVSEGPSQKIILCTMT